jgi:hypothetical protein
VRSNMSRDTFPISMNTGREGYHVLHTVAWADEARTKWAGGRVRDTTLSSSHRLLEPKVPA